MVLLAPVDRAASRSFHEPGHQALKTYGEVIVNRSLDPLATQRSIDPRTTPFTDADPGGLRTPHLPIYS